MEEDFNIKIKKQKMKILVCSKNMVDRTGIKLKNEMIQEEEEFNYLGSKITSDGRSCMKIVSRIHQTKTTFNEKKNVLNSKKISFKVRKKFLQTYVWSVVLYVCKWATEKKKLLAFKVWCHRRMLRISWVEKLMDEELFCMGGEYRSSVAIKKKT